MPLNPKPFPRRAFLQLLLWFLAVLGASASSAQTAPAPADVRLVIDVSGSMKKNDPNDLRQPAVDLLVRLLPEGSQAGVWTFGKFVNMLVPHGEVNAAWRAEAKAKAQQINAVGLFTNIGEALEKAAHDALSLDPDANASIILLTDGMVDIAKDPERNRQERQRIVEQLLPRLKEAGYSIHTIALSANADQALMEKLALATDGLAATAENAEQLMKIFLEAFDAAAPAQQVPLQGNGFVVDSSVEEFTALIFRANPSEQTQLKGPDDSLFDQHSTDAGVRWHRSGDYDLITVKQPLEGQWQVLAELEPESRVTVVSNLNLRVKSIANNLFRGDQQTLNFLLSEDGNTITAPEFLGLLQAQAALHRVTAEQSAQPVWQQDFSQQAIPANGIYSAVLPAFDQLGEYQLSVAVDGKTFERQFKQTIVVREPFSAELKRVRDEQGAEQDRLLVRSHSDLIVPEQTQIAVSIRDPQRRKKVKPLTLSDMGNWQTPLYFDHPGEYQLEVRVTGVDERGDAFDYTLQPLQHRHDPDAAFNSVPPAEPPAPEPAAEPPPTKPAPPPPQPQPEPEPPEPAPAAPEPSTSEGLPNWLLYAALGLGNLLLFGAGYWAFKKLMQQPENAIEEQFAEQTVAQSAPEAPPPQAEDAVDESLMAMDDASGDDEEPPMEDLESIEEEASAEKPPEVFDDETTEDDIAQMIESELSADEQDASQAHEAAEDDYGVDDLEDELLEQVGGDMNDDEKEDFAQEMLKAQGLDLGEEEMDDAISNLIDELDGSEAGQGEPQDENDFGLDDDERDKS